MSLPEYDERLNNRRDVFRSDALSEQFRSYPCTVKTECPHISTVPKSKIPVETTYDPKALAGMGVNNGVLEYQFTSMQDMSFCGTPLADEDKLRYGQAASRDCAACPCLSGQSPDALSAQTLSRDCDYGFARTFSSIFGPTSGNRNAMNRWG